MCQTGNPRNCFFHSLYGHAKSSIDDPIDPRKRESRLRIETHSEFSTAACPDTLYSRNFIFPLHLPRHVSLGAIIITPE